MTISSYLAAKISIYFEIHKFSEDYFVVLDFFLCSNTPPLFGGNGALSGNKAAFSTSTMLMNLHPYILTLLHPYIRYNLCIVVRRY